MIDFYSLTRDELAGYFAFRNQNRSKAKFLMRAVYSGAGLKEAEGISDPLKERICRDMSFALPVITERREDVTACKYLLRLSDESLVESVMMKEPYGNAVCVSTQLGCNMGCAFCESGRQKKIRDLTAGEIVSQVVAVAADTNAPVVGVSLMGVGEPFDNYENVVKAVNILTDQFGLSIAPRKVTVSTCGIVPIIERFTREKVNCNLAISLHAPDDGLRGKLMPVNKAYPLSSLIPALAEYSKTLNRRVAVEYIMLEKVNDTRECAKKLSDLLCGFDCYVNIIPYNPTDNIGFAASGRERILEFYDELKKNGVRVTMRRKMGENLSAACGQLRAEAIK